MYDEVIEDDIDEFRFTFWSSWKPLLYASVHCDSFCDFALQQFCRQLMRLDRDEEDEHPRISEPCSCYTGYHSGAIGLKWFTAPPEWRSLRNVFETIMDIENSAGTQCTDVQIF